MEEGTSLRRNEDKLLKKAIEHACTIALYHGGVSSVVEARVKSDNLYEATNPGEYFYDGKTKISGTVVAQADELGFAYEPSEGSQPTPK